jgi:hypothetical protein
MRLFPIIPDLLRLFPPQSANNPSPKSKKALKPGLSKMQLHVFFFYHTTKNSAPISSSNIQIFRQVLLDLMLKFFHIQFFLVLHEYQSNHVD